MAQPLRECPGNGERLEKGKGREAQEGPEMCKSSHPTSETLQNYPSFGLQRWLRG